MTPEDRKTAKGVIEAGNVAAIRFTINGTYQGREAVIGFVAGAAQATGNTLRMTVHRLLDDGYWSVAIATYTATRPTADGQAHLENNLAHVARLERGLIAESWLHSRDQYEVDAFWGPPA